MIEVYNKYNKLEATFEKLDSHIAVVDKCKQLKIKFTKLIRKTYKKLFTYYCPPCKKRSYFEEVEADSCCAYCNSNNKFFFVGITQTKQIIEEDITYANASFRISG